MRVKVTTEVDMNLKMMVEAVKDPVKPTFRKMLEEKMLEYLVEHDPEAALKADIQSMEQELNEKRQQLAAMQILQPVQKQLPSNEITLDDLEARRIAWLKTEEENITRAIKKRYVNWPNIAKSGGFLSAGEAERWVKQTIEKWKEKHENGHP